MLFLSWARFVLNGHRRFFVVRGPVPRKFPTRRTDLDKARDRPSPYGSWVRFGLKGNFLFS